MGILQPCSPQLQQNWGHPVTAPHCSGPVAHGTARPAQDGSANEHLLGGAGSTWCQAHRQPSLHSAGMLLWLGRPFGARGSWPCPPQPRAGAVGGISSVRRRWEALGASSAVGAAGEGGQGRGGRGPGGAGRAAVPLGPGVTSGHRVPQPLWGGASPSAPSPAHGQDSDPRPRGGRRTRSPHASAMR